MLAAAWPRTADAHARHRACRHMTGARARLRVPAAALALAAAACCSAGALPGLLWPPQIRPLPPPYRAGEIKGKT